jgi:regulator of sigma E protease
VLVVIGFICILLLVIAHEAGHFFAARRSGIEVEEFGVGFPPRAKVLAKKNGTEYTLNWLPLGGFVKLKGEHDSDTTEGSFGAARLRDKIKVMLAGAAVNFLIAYLLFTLIALIGMPKLVDNQFTVASDTKIVQQDVLVGFIDSDSPASAAGLESTDRIRNVAEQSTPENPCADTNTCQEFILREPAELSAATQALAGKTVTITVERSGAEEQLTATLLSEEEVQASRDSENPKGYLGVVPNEFVVQRSTWSAPIVGAGVTAQFTALTFNGLASIVTGLVRGDTQAATEQVSGVVGVGYVFDSASFLGPVFMLMIVAVISLSLAIMNSLPIPALDGGRLFVTLLFRVLKKPLTKDLEEKIHGTGFALLMVLFVLITIVDVQRFIL